MVDALTEFSSRFHPPGETPGEGVASLPAALALPSLTGAADAFLALALASGQIGGGPAGRPALVLAVTPGLPDADRLVSDLELLAGGTVPLPDSARDARVLEFPPPLDGDRAALGLRLKALAALRAWDLRPAPCVVVAPSATLPLPVPRKVRPAIELGGPAAGKHADICARLAEAGYNRVPQVERVGDYSVRGGIIDAWSPGDEFPVRAEFFGDDLESLRLFDAGSQRSVRRVDAATLQPVTDGGTDGGTARLVDLLPAGAVILALEHTAYGRLDLPDESRGVRVLYTGAPAPAGVPSCGFQTVPLPGFAELDAGAAHHPEMFAAAKRRLDQCLDAARQRGDALFTIDGLSGGFELPGLVVVTKADRVFTRRQVRPRRSTAAAATGARLDAFDDLEPGEYVVHVDHGVGRFVGSSEIVAGGRRTEVFNIEYADGALLHVPAAHAHLLSRYIGVKGEAVKLHRLDGRRWEKDKRDAQQAVADLAVALLETQARREIVPGFAYEVEGCDGLAAFEAAFPYEETPDQAAAIAAVKQDLAQRKPMDRLICGDAGYGKTEVAMRAAYIAALNGKQVAVLAPTTVLAEQHFETFTSRFDGTPVRIESMSRFQSARTHQGTLGRLASGVCDIVIGTHALLTPKIAFHDLGLIIIDEEQRFGVRHKEFLKRLRATADVLTLSATPIPRTLYLSMTGARDLSLLRSPPRERVAVDTKIVTDSDEIVRHAIEAELGRGGQVFFLHNRVTTIAKVEKRLQSVVPGARIVVAHGQMDATTLARKMRAFERGEFDVLLSTTIIGAGIDIPRANTILVDHAERFGLADLYQLRGRVGRSASEGHAVFLLPTGGLVDSDARERLKALQRHGGLGSGFNLAVRDLELRGAGNLLGAQQSGHIAAVGFGLYCQLLQRTISTLKGEKQAVIVDVRLNLDFIDWSPASDDPDEAAALPYDYIEEDAQRIGFLKRFAEAADPKAIQALGAELADRFGPLPAAAKRFVRTAELRLKCAVAGYDVVDAQGGRAIFYRDNGRTIAKVIDLRGKTPDRKLAELITATA